MPLTPSPKFSPKPQSQHRLAKETPPSIHTIPIFAQATGKSTARKSIKSNIARNSPRSLELGVSEWTLTGTPSKASSHSGALRPGVKARAHNKAGVRIAYNAADRFIPNRAASDAICNVGTGKIEHRPKSSHSQTSSAGSSILASSAATAGSAFDIGRGAEDDVTSALDGLTIADRDDDADEGNGNGKSKYTKPAPDAVAYESSIANACGVKLNTRILAFKPAPPESNKPIDLRSQYNRPLKPANALSAQLRRRILSSPERVLDAPNIVDDYYLNLLDWSCNNQVAIGLGTSVYVWSADSGTVSSLLETAPDTYVASLRWSGDGAYVSVGLGTGEVQIWDVEEGTKLRSMFGHETRVSVMGKSFLPSLSSPIQSQIANSTHRLEQAHAQHRRAERLALQPRRAHRLSQNRHAGLPHRRSVRTRMARRRHTARIRRQRQPSQHLGRARATSAQVPENEPQRGRQGALVVPLAAQPPGHRRREPRPAHPLLEHDDGLARQQHRHGQPGDESEVERALQGDREHFGLSRQRHQHLELSEPGQEYRDPRA